MNDQNEVIIQINDVLDVNEDEDEADIFSINKKSFFDHLQMKLDKMIARTRIIKFKYSKYKQYYDWVNIFIILISTLLTLIEAAKNEFNLDETNDENSKNFLQYLPVFFSCLISTSAALLKFKKYQEKMELIGRTIEKSIFVISKIKKLQEELCFTNSMKDIDDAKTKYQSEIYELYNACNEDIEKHLKDTDMKNFQEKINDIDLEVLLMEKGKEKLSKAIESDIGGINTIFEQTFKKGGLMKKLGGIYSTISTSNRNVKTI